jgi:N-carbamoyl-L-amino-acid hydrolase
MIEINHDRLMDDLHRAADFGRYKTGVHRPTFSPQDMDARYWLAEKMRAAGLAATVDGVGNVIGRSNGTGRKLLLGSHSESQNHAGWLDGILGVIYAIETARALVESGQYPDLGVDVGVWADEENHFLQFLGSRSFCNRLEESDIAGARNKDDGTPLPVALRLAGLEGRPREHLEAGRYQGYLEAHIEQGDYLDSTGLKIGVVTSIVGLWQYKIRFVGEQNHAGTTRMAARKDAGAALIKLAGAIDDNFPKIAGKWSVWTTGRIDLMPGLRSIIPGESVMVFQFRDADPAQLEIFEQKLLQLVAESNAAGPCRCEIEVLNKAMPMHMDDSFQATIEKAAEHHAPGQHVRMPSGAIHDAQILATQMPAGMVFVPSIGGISHHYVENTSTDDIILGCRVFATAAEMLLAQR